MALVAALQVFDPARLLPLARLVCLPKCVDDLLFLPVPIVQCAEALQYSLSTGMINGHRRIVFFAARVFFIAPFDDEPSR